MYARVICRIVLNAERYPIEFTEIRVFSSVYPRVAG